jgi:hypothetical protein
MRRPAVLYGSLAIVAVGLVVACGDDPSPVKPSPLTPSPFAAIQVMGPDSIGPSQSAQFVAIIRQADGTTKSATSMPNLRWTSSDTSVLLVSSSGVVTSLDSMYGESVNGEAVITAELIGQTAVRGTREVVVQPEGTYRIVGSVRGADAPTVPIAGARVEVLPGSNFTLTGPTGQYRLYGVPPQSTIRITAVEYETLDEPLQLTANVTRNFGLKVDERRFVLNGPYTISVDTTPCSRMDSALLHRTYDAVLTTMGTVVDVVLTEPRFRIDESGRGNRFSGRVFGGGAEFTLEHYYQDGHFSRYPNLVERLEDNTYLAIAGHAITAGTAAGLTGTLTGDLDHWDSRFPSNAIFPSNGFLASCSDADFQFRVTPR